MNFFEIIQNKLSSGKKKRGKIARINPDPDMGLTSSQVDERIAKGYTNSVPDKTTKPTSIIILSNIFTFFNIIYIVLAVLLILVGSYKNLTILVVAVINTVIGIVQEIRSKKTLEKLTLVSAPLTEVIRDGQKDAVGQDDLVIDDIAVFGAGNQIPADAVVCDGEVNVNESLVTGESDEIKKKAGDQLLSGSFVVSGSCRARLDKVGRDSFASKLSSDAKKIQKKQQPGMMRSLTLLIRVIGIVIIPLGILTYNSQLLICNGSQKEALENMSGAITGMIPQGLYLLTTIALAVSTMRLAKKNTLVHDMKCIETLARVDVICVDKTGTVTEPEMNLEKIVSVDGTVTDKEASDILKSFAFNMGSDNITMAAIKKYFGEGGNCRRAERIRSFSSATKYSAVSYGKKENIVLGAPEFILLDDYPKFRPAAERFSMHGERVLLLAEYHYRSDDGNIFEEGKIANGTVIPIAVVTLKNRIRPEAKQTFEYFAAQGVDIKVISGDNPVTVYKAAEEAGIPNADKYIDATTLTTKEKIANAVNEYTVFGRVTPDQKRAFVKALKKAGHTVAMTGDGVNDVLALKDADCSIAMASGSDAAANVSDLVLLDSNFGSMPSVVAEGRRVINNIERSASLYLMKNIFSFVMTIIALIASSLYPFQPSQLLLIEMVMIGIPSFFLALEPNENIIKGKFLSNVLNSAAPVAINAVIMVGWALLFGNAFELSNNLSSTIAFYVFAVVAYMMLFKVCKPMTTVHKILFGAMGVIFVLAVIFVPEIFTIYELGFKGAVTLAALIFIAVTLERIILTAYEKAKNLPAYIKKIISEKTEA